MNPDDPVCLCFHVTRRKVVNFIRIEKPRRPSQLSQCFGAGTGCGWCRPYLERLLADETGPEGIRPSNTEQDVLNTDEEKLQNSLDETSLEQYAKERAKFVREGGGTPPPGATPIDDE